LTVNLLQTNVGQWDTVTVSPDTSSLSSPFQLRNCVQAAVDAVNQQHGQMRPLAGSSLIDSLGQPCSPFLYIRMPPDL